MNTYKAKNVFWQQKATTEYQLTSVLYTCPVNVTAKIVSIRVSANSGTPAMLLNNTQTTQYVPNEVGAGYSLPSTNLETLPIYLGPGDTIKGACSSVVGAQNAGLLCLIEEYTT